MEIVEGEDLASILRGNGPLAPRQAARVSAEAAKALQAAHIRGIVHRDVKPSNILVGRDGRIKVADFGIARALNEAQLTLPGTTMGSVHYFSPEQARGEPATVASDIYALGIVLFETLTGQRPFSGDGAAAVALARLTTTPPRPSALRQGVPPELDAIVTKAMSLDPAARYASAAAMASALEGYLTDAGDSTKAVPAVVAGAAAAATVAAATARPNPPAAGPVSARRLCALAVRPRSRRRAAPRRPRPAPSWPRARTRRSPGPWAWVAGLLGIAVLAIIGFLLFRLLTGGGAAGESPSPSASAEPVTVPSYVDMLDRRGPGRGERHRPRDHRLGHRGIDRRRPGHDPQPGPASRARSCPSGTPDPRDHRPRPGGGHGARRARRARGRGAPADRPGASLAVGTRSEDFDPTIPIGAIIDTEPGAGIVVAPATPDQLHRVQGPRAHADPDAHAHADPDPTPTPTPTPTAHPDPGAGERG